MFTYKTQLHYTHISIPNDEQETRKKVTVLYSGCSIPGPNFALCDHLF